MSRKPSPEFIAEHPEVSVCGRCGCAVHKHHTEAHVRRCIDSAVGGPSERSE